MTPSEGRYSKVTRRIWSDDRFRALSAPKPNGRDLFIRLLTAPELTAIPGLFQAWSWGIAQSLGWSIRGFESAMRELRKAGLAEYDEASGTFWLSNALRHNEPESPNVIRGWAIAWAELPESELKAKALRTFSEWATAKGQPWVQALEEATGKTCSNPEPKPSGNPSGNPSRKPSGNPSQKAMANQEQEQEQEQDLLLQGATQQQPQPEAFRDAPAEEPPPASMVRPMHGAATLQERAREAIGLDSLAHLKSPQTWPEVVSVAQALIGPSIKLGPPPRDRGTLAILQLFDAGFTPEEVKRAIGNLRSDAWWNSAPRGLSALSIEVVRRALGQQTDGKAQPVTIRAKGGL